MADDPPGTVPPEPPEPTSGEATDDLPERMPEGMLDGITVEAVAILDEEGNEVVLDGDELLTLFALTDALDRATISACPGCRSRVLACLALADLLDVSPPHARTEDLIEFADDAPSSHCYVQDLASRCRHRHWHDPGRREWETVLARFTEPRRIVP